MESEERAKKKEMAPEKKLLEGKTTAAEEMEKRVGDPGVSTKGLIDGLVSLQREVVASGEDINLAGYSDACISFILKDLETTGVSKDRQPKLLCLLYDQLNQGRLPQLLSILTPSPTQPSPSASILKRPVCDLNSSSEVMNLKT